MAGMLPGVECARRRRFHQSGIASDSQNSSQGWTRRPSFCLYTTNYHEKSHHINSTSFPHQRGMLAYQDDDKLGVEAREAKERLDERLRTQRKSDQPKRKNNESNHAIVAKGDKAKVVKNEAMNNSNNNNNNNNRNINGSMKKSSDGGGSSRRLLKWGRFSWKASEQEECTICLEGFKRNDNLVHLPCAHKFHNTCLLPWLETNSHCPCCRLGIVL